ncbi:MAG TPA: DNA primase, partial [Anaerolineae bacterium]|nr:DNA primase [Anaerolineae bacterium]
FHTEKTPSFIVFPVGQRWHCFGACGTGGDVFTFIQKIENMDFVEALKLLARKAGVSLPPRGERQAAEDEQRRRLREINAAAAHYFHHLLLNSTAGERARAYLAHRAIAEETIRAFQLGLSLDSWDALIQYLTGKGYDLEDIHAAGLIIEREGGGFYDRFRGRLMFPIRDAQGRVIGFGARTLDDSTPKYLNSPQTPLFNKSSVLYGLDMAKEAIRRQGSAIVVEGYMDVLTAHQNGIQNVVASLGTAITESQLRTLKRWTKSFVLALDADAAGSAATLRGLEVAKEALDQQPVPVPTWRGLIRYEHRLEADLRILILPPGQDPDQVIRADPQRWARLVQEALPVVEYYFTAFTADLDLESPKGKSLAVRRLLPVIQEIGDRVEQAHYLQKLARLVWVDERTLWQELQGRGAKRAAKREGEEAAGLQAPSFGLEEYGLSLLLQEPGTLEVVGELLAQVGDDLPQAEDFTRVENRELFAALRGWLEEDRTFDLEAFRQELPEPLREHLDFLLQRAAQEPPLPEEKLRQEAGACFLRLRERSRRGQLAQLRFLLEDAEERGDSRSVDRYREMVRDLTAEIERLQQALKAGTRPERDDTSFWSPLAETSEGAGII